MSEAVERALKLLEYVAAQAEPVSTMHAAGALGIDKSTCSRALATLAERGWLMRDEQTRLYSSGPTLVRLTALANPADLVRPMIARLAALTGETVSFNRRAGDQRVCIAGHESKQVVRCALPLGESFPLHVGPSGKAILAFVDEACRERVLKPLPEHEVRYVRSIVASAQRSGVAVTDGDHVPGVGGLAVPVFGRDGVVGSLTLAGPMHRWSGDQRRRAVPTLLAAGGELSDAFGAAGRQHQLWLDAWLALEEGGAAS